MLLRAARLITCLLAVAGATFVGCRVIPVNATTIGFVYLLLVLVVASTWGFLESALASVIATMAFNYYFLPPVGALTIADPQNWVALFAFLTTSLIASRLSTAARRRAMDALARQQDLEHLYTFSRAILLAGREQPFSSQLVRSLVETFGFTAAVLYDRRTGESVAAGTSEFEGLQEQLRDSALRGTAFADHAARRTITAVRLGAEPIASLALQGFSMPDSVVQGIANLVAIGLERARAQELAREVEVARQSEQLRTTLIDAMAHEFKTPLTLIKGATTSILAGETALSDTTREQLVIADEEAEHLRELLDDAIEMARLDTAHIEVHLERSDLAGITREVIASFQTQIENRPLEITVSPQLSSIPLDKRLVKLALRQLLDNALKYSPPDTPVTVRVCADGMSVLVEITDRGPGIPPEERRRIFDRFYRGQSVRHQVPGTGLGLTIAHSILRAHQGDLTVSSRPGETTFRMTLPMETTGGIQH